MAMHQLITIVTLMKFAVPRCERAPAGGHPLRKSRISKTTIVMIASLQLHQ
ncbi:hypothetical protein [Bradyrhizobium iriomotense]|uniref:Transposase n=1 Tax=Bradyrhizobium iriomotense TaxID=441950 RepID=A0ABQ6BCT5_9BRAD|nr:hypothetical protein [Bradyrhizobium iriomotense]GLR92202.1 hypothetical protein GCM10007857_89220 [Bradyrhizobium iriomotense]